MTFKKLTPKNTYIVSIASNEDIVKEVQDFVKEQGIKSGYVMGIGALKTVRYAHYIVSNKKYTERKVHKPLELANITGIITTDKVHLHATTGDQRFNAHAGHVVRAIVSAACELIVVETEEEVRRKKSEEIGLDLLNL